MPVPVRVRSQFRALGLRVPRHGRQGRWYSGLPHRQGDEDPVAPDFQAQWQVIFRDVSTVEHSLVPCLDTVEFKIHRGPGVHLSTGDSES